MPRLKFIYFLFFVTTLISCNHKQKKTNTQETTKPSEVIEISKAQRVLNETIEAHGGDLYTTAHYSFVFRDHTFQFKNNGNAYEYKKTSQKNDSTVVDILINGDFKRLVNGDVVTLSEKEKKIGTGAINSVIYFATLPHKLNDQAVHATYVESTTIKNKNYDVLEITFAKEGGGEDHDDEYYYWINQETQKIDYLAYNYTVNKGGVRFRSAYNTRVVDGITFQDYINYKAAVGTPLKDLPALYEAEQLKELSKIKTEQIINLNNN